MFVASALPSNISQQEIISRNSFLDEQLKSKGLYTSDVRGDGNCFFRSLSVCLHGHENEHSLLRKDIANHMKINVDSSSILNGTVIQHIVDVGTDGVWAGEDVIVASADYLCRDIQVFLATDKSSPRTYCPTTCISSLPSLRIAYYEPGHYVPVFSMNGSTFDDIFDSETPPSQTDTRDAASPLPN